MWAKLLRDRKQIGERDAKQRVQCPMLWRKQAEVSPGPTQGSRTGLQKCSRWRGRRWLESRKVGWKCVVDQLTPCSTPPQHKMPSFLKVNVKPEQLRASLGWKEAVRTAAEGRRGCEEALYWEQEVSMKVGILNSKTLSWLAPGIWQPGWYPLARQGLEELLSEETDLTIKTTLRYWHCGGPHWKATYQATSPTGLAVHTQLLVLLS